MINIDPLLATGNSGRPCWPDTLGLTAFVLSIPLGALLTYLVVKGTSDGFGFTIPTLYPWIWVPFVAMFAIVIAVVAAIAPGRRASRLEVVSALQYE